MQIAEDDIPAEAIVAGLTMIGQYLNERGDLPLESLAHAFQVALREALVVCIARNAKPHS